MATRDRYYREEINSSSKFFSQTKSIIETAFYGNNVDQVVSLKEAYKLARKSPGTIETDMSIYQPEQLGLTEDSNVLLFNDGEVHGRCAGARRIMGEHFKHEDEITGLLKEAVYKTRGRKMYHAQSFIGLHENFMIKARLLVPEGHENILYNWLLNFQIISQTYTKRYQDSDPINESDIYVFSDPDWSHPDYPLGLAFFDPESNCAAILGMRYFGEFKKGTLTLAWTIANRNGYVSCHGGMKRYNLSDDDKYVMGFLGLSGSGKSTLTHAKHDSKYDVSILHDDALIISTDDGSSIALEPSYFDKTSDYPLTSKDNKFLLSVQNCGVTLDHEGRKVVVTEDIRNKNGRALKSKFWSDNRVDIFEEKVDSIVWLMKDASLPPVVKVTDPILAATMGALLATKRTSAERLSPGHDYDELVIEPYANPFRTYPLRHDYAKFKELFEKTGVACYIFNTGYFRDKKITKEVTLGCLENIVEDHVVFKDWEAATGLQLLEVEGYQPDLTDDTYLRMLKKSFQGRLDYMNRHKVDDSDFNQLPEECFEAIEGVMKNLVNRDSSWQLLA